MTPQKMALMTLEQHLQTADDLAIVQRHMSAIFDRLKNHYPMSSRMMKLLWKVLPNANNPFSKIKSYLDNDFHELITDAQFKELGHIYYNLDLRYETLINAPISDTEGDAAVVITKAQALQFIDEARWRITSGKPSTTGKGSWLCGGAYWRLASVLDKFLLPNLEQQEGSEHAKFIISTHGQITK